MTTHELAKILLQQEDVPVEFHFYHDEANCYCSTPINVAELYEGVMYLAETEFVSPEEEERRWQEECRRVIEERRKREEEEAKKLTWGKLLSLTAKETQEAMLSFYVDDWDKERYLSLEIDPKRISYLLSLHFVSNARLTKDHMSELVSAAEVLGLTIDPKLIELFDHYVSMTRYNTDREQLAALRASRNNK